MHEEHSVDFLKKVKVDDNLVEPVEDALLACGLRVPEDLDIVVLHEAAAHLVDQFDRSQRVPEVAHRAVQILDLRTLLQHHAGLEI